MSLADQASNLTGAGASMRKETWGQPITIKDLAGGDHAFIGVPVSGPGGIDPVTGGFYDLQTITAEIKTGDLAGFVPEPGMFASVLGQDMRIAPDGVTPGIFVYRLRFVSAKSPSRNV